jgi:hypothetical protein
MLLALRRHDQLGRAALTLAAAAVLGACSEEEVPVVRIAHPTLVEVRPEEFLGAVVCRDAPGAMRRYVATAYDLGPEPDEGEEDVRPGCNDGAGGAAGTDEPVDEADKGFALPSSTIKRGEDLASAIPCTQRVGFSRIVEGHRYWAEVEGYDRDDLVALEPGTRILYDQVSGVRVPPRWTTRCSWCNPVTGLGSIVRTIGTCDPLEDAMPSTGTLIIVGVEGALDGLDCGSADGEVERFEVTPPGGAAVGAACGETVTLTGLETGGTITFPLRAFAAGASEAGWGTTCVAEAIAGVTTTATCLPLTSEGALEVDPMEALAALGLECDAATWSELLVEMTDGDSDERHIAPSDCSRSVVFQGRPSGAATARATARLTDGTRSSAALCTGTVVPGDTARATCAPEP